MQRAAHGDHLLQRGRGFGAGIEGPHGGIFLADIQTLVAVVGHATFGLAGYFELAYLLATRCAGGAVEAVLQEGAVLVVSDGVDRTLAVLKQAQAVDVAQRRGDLANIVKLAAARVDGEQVQAVVIAVAGHRQIHPTAAQLEAITHIDVVQAAHRQVLHLLASQVVDTQAALLVGAQHAARGRLGGIDPDRRIVGGIAEARHRIGLHLHRQNGNRRCRRRCLGLPVEVQLPRALFIGDQYLHASIGDAGADPLRLVEPFERQHGFALPVAASLSIQVQRRRFGIEQQQATRHLRHAGCGFGKATERLAQVHRRAQQRCLGSRGVMPEANAFLVDVERCVLVIHLAVATFRRQTQPAHTLRRGQRALGDGHQPLLADALFAQQKGEVVARLVAEQAQALDGERGFRNVHRLAPAPLAIQPQQQRLLAARIEGGDQQALCAGAVIQPLETPLESCHYPPLGIEQLHAARALADLQPVRARPEGIVGEELRMFGVQHRAFDRRQFGQRGIESLGGRLGLARGQGDAEAQEHGFFQSGQHGFFQNQNADRCHWRSDNRHRSAERLRSGSASDRACKWGRIPRTGRCSGCARCRRRRTRR